MRQRNTAATPPTLPPENTDLRQATRNFKRLSRSARLQLAHEIALTRGRELCLAYKNLVAVSSGFRTRRASPGATPSLRREPCVGFIVDRKWGVQAGDHNPQSLPRHLFAFSEVDGARVLCAVPTDVRSRRDYGRPVPHDGDGDLPFGVLVDSPTASAFASGVVTCAVQRPVVPATSFVMSCRHVLSCTDLVADPDGTGLQVLLGTTARPVLGKTTVLRGRLGDDSAFSFDAQLAVIGDQQALKRAQGGLSFDAGDSFVAQPGDISDGFWIATGRSDADGKRVLVWVDYQDTVENFRMDYEIEGRMTTVVHRLVLHGVPEATLQDGDSGSPAVRVRRGQRLIGMYIGGSSGHAYVIPAWQLMTPKNFGKPSETNWALV